MKRNFLIAGNWKMNMLPSQVPGFADELLRTWKPAEGVECALCVPFPILPALSYVAAGTGIAVGAQDVSAHEAGAYTGEVSALMLADLGVTYGIVGHSERRGYHGETNALVNEKLKMLHDNNIRPIMCVGESLSQRDGGETLTFVAEQVKEGLAGLTAEDIQNVVIAYEPIWAIGTGRTATSEQAQEVCAHIRETLRTLFGETADTVRVLYGGSMNAKNASELLAMPDIDGGLIGGASLKPVDFAAILEAGAGHVA